MKNKKHNDVIRLDKLIENIPPEVFVPIGGYVMSFLNKYTKVAAYDLWKYAKKRGKYDLSESDKLKIEVTGPNQEIFQYCDNYDTWHIHYDEKTQPFDVYLCTRRGFFNLNFFYDWTIIEALPSRNPILSDPLKNIYNRLNKLMGSKASEDDIARLEKVQILCLLNLLLKDLITISEFDGNNLKNKLPKLLKDIVKSFNTLKNKNGNDTIDLNDIKAVVNGSAKECADAKQFLEMYSGKIQGLHKLFYKNNDETKQEEKTSVIFKLGMFFEYNINDIIVLSVSEDLKEKDKFLSEGILMAGNWKKKFKLQYCFAK